MVAHPHRSRRAKFSLYVNCDNDAFLPEWQEEVARILHELVNDRVDDLLGDSGTLRDINGNTIGRWEYRPARRSAAP